MLTIGRVALRIVVGAVVGLGALAAIGGVLLCENALRPSRRVVAASRPAGWEEVTLRTADGVRLAAWLRRPSGGGRRCVVLLHGIADSRSSQLGLAPMFLDSGYAVLIPDSRGHGESGGEIISYGVMEKWDVLAWVNWLRASGCGEVFGLGESMGAAILLQAAAEQPVFRAIVTESSFASLRWIAEDRLVQHLPGQGFFRRVVARTVVAGGFVYAHLRYGLDLDAAAPVRSAAHLRTPVLLIQGLSDTNVMPEHAKAIAAASLCVSLWFVPGAQHAGAAAADPEGFRRRVLGWFERAG